MALTTNTRVDSAGVVNHTTGYMVQNAVADPVTLSLGFVPRYFKLVNLTDRITYEWYSGMATTGGAALKTIATGVRTLETTEGPTFGTAALGTADAVTLSATLMVASKTFAWEALA